MTLSVWQDEKNKPVEKYDVAIVGGGIMGAGAAYWLAKRNLRVCLVESGELASGASGRNAGFLLRGIHTYYNETVKRYGRDNAAHLFRFTEENLQLIAEFAKQAGKSFDYQSCGSYLLACSVDELQDLDESAQLMKEDGFAVEYLKKDPLERDYYGALHNACDGGVHPAKLVKALVEVSGVTVLEGSSVASVQSNQNGVRLTSADRVIECQKALITTNAYTPLLEPSLQGLIEPIRGQILVTEPLSKTILDKVCYANYGWEYFRQLPDGRFLLGGCRQLFQDTEVGYADTISATVQNSLDSYLKERFDDIAGVKIDYRWSGTMAFTQDGLPLVGELKNLPGVHIAVGCNGHGFSYGLNLSRLLVDVAFDGKDAGIFSTRRIESTTQARK